MHMDISTTKGKIAERTAQLNQGNYGVGRLKKNRDWNGPGDRAWTENKLRELEASLIKLESNKDHQEQVEKVTNLKKFASSLLVRIQSYYTPSGPIGRWQKMVECERIVAEFPDMENKAKRKVEDAERELRFVRARFERAKEQLK